MTRTRKKEILVRVCFVCEKTSSYQLITTVSFASTALSARAFASHNTAARMVFSRLCWNLLVAVCSRAYSIHLWERVPTKGFVQVDVTEMLDTLTTFTANRFVCKDEY